MRNQAADPGQIVSITDVEIVRLTEWVIWCKVKDKDVGIPRGRVDASQALAVSSHVTLRVPRWFARSVGLDI